jgi:hypothetical protein
MIRFAQRVSLSLRQPLVLGAPALTLLALASGASAFTFTPIDVPGAGFTQAYGINKAGQIVGAYYDGTGIHGFLRSTDGTFTTFDAQGAQEGSTNAFGIGGKKIVGYYLGLDGPQHGYLRNAHGTLTTIDVPGPQPQDTYALGISRKNIVGGYLDKDGVRHGFLATP